MFLTSPVGQTGRINKNIILHSPRLVISLFLMNYYIIMENMTAERTPSKAHKTTIISKGKYNHDVSLSMDS